MSEKKQRDDSMDAVKGIAIFFVVLDHVMRHTFINPSNLGLSNFIWSVQMPTFMVISGYYSSKPLNSFRDIKKMARMYLLPSCTYIYLIQTLILGRYESSFIKATIHISNSLNDALWFLIVLFFLQLINKCALYMKRKKSNIIYALTWAVCLVPILILGYGKGFSFFGIKYLLYYSIYFVSGVLFREKEMLIKEVPKRMMNVVILFMTIIFALIVSRINLYEIEDNVMGIVFRVITGFIGSYLLLWVGKTWTESFFKRIFAKMGFYSLEIYASHLLFLNLLDKKYELCLEGILAAIMLFLWVMVGTVVYIFLIKMNPLTNLLCFGKIENKKGIESNEENSFYRNFDRKS